MSRRLSEPQVKRATRNAPSFAFRMAKPAAPESVRELGHIKTAPGIEIFFIAAWIAAGVVWTVAIKVGAVMSAHAAILGFAGIIATGWMVLRALRVRSHREAREYYGAE